MSARLRRRPWVMQAVALYDYGSEEPDELPLAEGQQIRVLQVQDDGWWLGYAADDPERVGLFPSNYVRQEYESQQQSQQQQNKAPEAQRQQRQGVRQHEEDDDDGDDDGGDEQQEQSQYSGREQEYDEEVQQHQRRTHQRIQHQRQYQRHKETNDSRRSRVDDEAGESEDEEEDAVVPAPPAQQRMVSVLQLKRSLADAERASEAARAARLKAERERAQKQRRRPPVRIARNEEVGAGDDDQDDDDDDEGFGRVSRARRQQQQQLRHRIPLEVEDDGDDDDDDGVAFRYNQGNQRRLDQEQDDDEQEDEQVIVNDDADDGGNGGGSFSVPAAQGSRMKGVISAYQAQQNVDQEEEEAAASRIARKYRDHRIRQQTQQDTSKQSQLHHQRSFAERENTAVLAIQWWMLRTSSQRRTRNQVLESERHEEDSERVAQEAELEQKAEVRAAAAARIQTWMRHLLTYFRWKEHVEKERVAMLKRKRVRMLQLEQEARRKAEQEQLRKQQEEEEEEEEERERLQLRLEQQELERQKRMQLEQEQRQAEQQQQQQQTASTHQREGGCQKEDKTRKKIMKKKAVDLVKTLVKKQLDEKLREHDEKMGELQRLMATLQDVICKQNEMLVQDSNAHLMVEQQGARKSIKLPMQTLGNQQQQQHYMPSSMRQLMQASVSSSSLASESHLPSVAAAVKESFIPKPSSHPSMLPQIGGNAAAKASKLSAIKPPRSNDVPSRLPALSNANARQSSNTLVKR